MLTSSASQYLHPDYLQPLPTTLDAKKSPLALLAQTCSSIGKDSGNTKSIIPPLEKKDSQKDKDSKSETPKSGSGDDKGRSSTTSDKRDGGASPGSGRTGESPKGGFRAPAPKDIPPLVPITTSTADKASSTSRGSPKTSTSTGERDATSSAAPGSVSTGGGTSSSASSSSSSSSSSSTSYSNSRLSLSCGSLMLDMNQQESAAKNLGLPPTHPALPGSLKADALTAPSALHPGLAAYPSLPLFGHPLAMDATSMYTNLSAPGGLASAAHKGLSPYVSYARVKTSTGATTLVPVCKDPYCTHCQMTMQSAQLSSGCAAGCTQCTHEKALGGPGGLSAHSGLGSLPLLPHSAASLSLASSLYPHAFGVFPTGGAGLPYVCNWMAGSEYCGKRFTTSDDLLQHLRTHTSSTEAAAAALTHAGLQYSALAPSLASCHGHYPTPGSLSPNALRQAYPRSMSPSSILAANRYHPYKSPLSSLPTPVGSALGTAGLPSLGAYYSPYSLYGQRLGAVAP